MVIKKGDDQNNSTKTYVITAAQGIQNPYNARMYGKNSSAGKPNKPLIHNIENYVKINGSELQICAIPGSYVNEIELDSFFHERDDVYIERNAKRRNEQNKEKEKNRREAWEEANEKRLSKIKNDETPGYIDELGKPMHYFWDEIPDTDYKITGKNLNSNIRTVGIPEPSQNKDPLVGKEPFTQKSGGTSIVMPSPKQRFKPVASGQAGEYPKLMMTTGCCTLPSYNTTNRQGFLADNAHKYGFVVVDILNDKLYLPRIVNAQKNGTFIELGIKYTKGKEPEKAQTTALIVGDSHVAQINPKVDKANLEMMLWFEPKYTHVGDTYDALAINLHQLSDTIMQDYLHSLGLDNMEREAVLTADYLYKHGMTAKKFNGEVLANFSNHDDMVYRFLTEQKFMNDKENRKFAYKLMAQDIDRDNTFETMIRYVRPDLPHNVKFLKRGEDRIYWGYQCAAHGHLGKNGARGSLKNLMEGYGKVIMQHVHTPEINSDSMSVGTSSIIPMPYQLGQPSTSMAANAVIYDGGLAQLIPIIKGRWSKEDFSDFLKK